MIQMQWWDKLDATTNIIWLVIFGVTILAGVVMAAMGIDSAGEVEKGKDSKESYLEDYERDVENMKVERVGWRAINEDLRKENEELKRKNAELTLECRASKLRLDKLLQGDKVVTLEDLQKDIESCHTRMEGFIDEQDQVLSAYTTGNFIVPNTTKQQKKLEALEMAQAHIVDARNYILQAKGIEAEQ